MTRAVSVLLVGVACVLAPAVASAGLLDKLNETTKKLNQATQQKRQSGGSQGGGNFGGSLSAGLGATSFEALGEHNKCFDPLTGSRMRFTADALERKLAATQGLPPERRKAWEADIAAVRAAQQAGKESAVSPDPKDPNRYTSWLTVQEQTQINADHGAFYNRVVSECQGRDHMNSGRATKMNYVQDNSATMASNATGEQTMVDLQACMAGVQGVRWVVTADLMEEKLAKAGTLSAKERAAWEADIAAVRAAAANGQMMPTSPDPSQPTRYMLRLAPEDQGVVNERYGAASEELMAKCSAQAQTSGKVAERDYTKGGGSTSPANKQAKRQQRKAAVGTGIGGTTNLEYMRRTKGCEKSLKGHLAKVTADTLEAKLKTAKGLTPQKRLEWEEDIAAWRQAERGGADQPNPPDPDNPYRWYDYVTNQERAAINQQHATLTTKVMNECASQDAGL